MIRLGLMLERSRQFEHIRPVMETARRATRSWGGLPVFYVGKPFTARRAR